MNVNPKTGLVPLECLKDAAGKGIIAGEVRGFPPEIAAGLVKKGLAKEVDTKAAKKAAAVAKTEA